MPTVESRFETALIAQVVRHGLAEYLESTRSLVALLDLDGTTLACNPAFERLRGSAGAASTLYELVAARQKDEARTYLTACLHDQQPFRAPLNFGTPGGRMNHACLFVPADGDTVLFFAEPSYEDEQLLAANESLAEQIRGVRAALDERTSELHALHARVDELAHTDSLTLLPNRRSIISSLERYVTYAERYGALLAVSMLDLDGFKAVNDSLGHGPGDRILSLVARKLRELIREPDEIGRYGGDEFLLLLPNSSAVGASEQASRLCEQLRARPVRADGSPVQLTLSIGIAQFTPRADTWQSLLERADRALLEAKRLGGDQWLILDT